LQRLFFGPEILSMPHLRCEPPLLVFAAMRKMMVITDLPPMRKFYRDRYFVVACN
jgi:hypothetical protein